MDIAVVFECAFSAVFINIYYYMFNVIIELGSQVNRDRICLNVDLYPTYVY
jgi:hypothetical protein